MKKIAMILILAILLPIIAGCTALGASNGQDATTQATQAAQQQQISVDSIQETASQELAAMAEITLNGSVASAEGDGVSISGSTVTITKAGSYTLTGTLTDGQIIVDVNDDDRVELILGGVTINSSASAAIYIQNAELTIITLADGTENSMSDAASSMEAQTDEEDLHAALYAKDDLVIRGTGTLVVHGNNKNGISSKNNILIEGGTITVDAVNNGIRGKDSVAVLGGTVTITAGNDGIQSDDMEAGAILIDGGSIHITAAHDGMQAATSLVVSGGEISILAGGGYTTEDYSAEESYKGLKSDNTVLVTGGTLWVNSLDDAIHATNDVTVSGGTLTLLSRDDGIHADETVLIEGGSIDIQICYEGLESAVINITGGTVALLAADDGINAADASQSGQSDRMGAFGGMGSGNASLQVNISGGVVTVNAYGDGIDSNGNVTMSGGELYISGPVSSGNGALDYDSTFKISGGVLAAAGSVGMAQTPSESSGQPSVIAYFSQMQSAGKTYMLANASGTVILSITPDKEFQCIVFSAPELTAGSSYLLYESSDGSLTNATALYDFTISGTITSVGGTGQTQQNWMQGPQQQRRP
ncbi:MAG TPA: carbohydrate-binding domain-containing protein [Candidatus Limiplasma sp.]|nr:carbohydrate-binding domain-containing protein [Candidatus Limiplasma sp.]HRX08455.1 carbohydrate-binding domain-containing protein [Candidatus Limiplasma sp.]